MSSPEYVENLSPEAKRKLLKEVIKPNIEVSKIYSPTSSYFEGQIKKSMDMFKCAFRSDLNIHGKAKFNTEKNRVETKATITYKTYKFEGSHEDLQIGIEGESADLGDATVFLQSGTSKNLVFQLVDKDNPKVSEKFKNPIGFYDPNPSFSWKLPEGVKSQTAYEIVVGYAPNPSEKVDLWSSGKVESDLSIFNPYGGLPLKSRDKSYWQVRFWDEEGNPSEWINSETERTLKGITIIQSNISVIKSAVEKDLKTLKAVQR